MGNWTDADARDTIGIYRPTDGTFYLRETNTLGAADTSHQYGGRDYVPIVGHFGNLPGDDDAPVNAPYLVSEFTTYHPPGEDRNINIDLIADMTDGAVVGPGEVFSLNDHVGRAYGSQGLRPGRSDHRWHRLLL